MCVVQGLLSMLLLENKRIQVIEVQKCDGRLWAVQKTSVASTMYFLDEIQVPVY